MDNRAPGGPFRLSEAGDRLSGRRASARYQAAARRGADGKPPLDARREQTLMRAAMMRRRAGELQPGLSNGGIEMICLNDMPNFIPTRSGPGTVVFMYDRPADCTTTVVWGERGDGWQGWMPDDPSGRASDGQRADLRWQTPIDPGKAKDVALRFRAHLFRRLLHRPRCRQLRRRSHQASHLLSQRRGHPTGRS